MKVTESVWLEKMGNLNDRRAKETIKNSVAGVDDYCGHLKMIKIGESLLDVGCGSAALKKCVPAGVEYWGLDPFPQTNDPFIINATIEDFIIPETIKGFDTVTMFAALDNVIDFKAAIENIKRLANKNVLFLTGVNIEPDKYHTIKITEQELILEMKPFKVGYMKYLHPKILLIEFVK